MTKIIHTSYDKKQEAEKRATHWTHCTK